MKEGNGTMEMTDLMLDLETVGTGANAAVLSIAAVFFCSDTGETGREFHMPVQLQSCLMAGLEADADTLLWWIEQEGAAKSLILEGQKYASPIALVLAEFATFCWAQFGDSHVKVWGNGPSFDCAILANCYKKIPCIEPLPWKHFNERCVRTVVDLAGGQDFKTSIPFEGVKHDALDDCRHQIKLVSEGLKKIRGNGPADPNN